MLDCKNLGGCHHTCLKAVIKGYKHGHQSHQGLSTSYIPLQKAVHLPAASHITAHLTNHPFLRTGQLERQILCIKGIKDLSHSAEHALDNSSQAP